MPLEAAFRNWSDASAIRHLDEKKAYSTMPLIFIVGGPDPYFDGHCEWCDRLEPLRRRFEARLRSGELVATGFAQPLNPASRRQVIAPALFELLELDYAASEARRDDLHYIQIEVCLPTAKSEPGDAADSFIAEPVVSKGSETFVCNGRYTKVRIREHHFFLSGGQCTIVKLLHEASRTADPWLETKTLLEKANYHSNSLGSVFKRHRSPSWKELIEQKREFSRLNL